MRMKRDDVKVSDGTKVNPHDKAGSAKMKQTASKAASVKREIDIENALRWAWRDELSKRQTSAAEAVWDRIDDYGRHGGVDVDGGGGQQRYDFGVPDPDAEALERAVAELEPVVIDWAQSIEAIAGSLAGLVDINDFKRQQPREPKAGWGKAGDRALRGWFGPGDERPVRDCARSMLMVGTFGAVIPSDVLERAVTGRKISCSNVLHVHVNRVRVRARGLGLEIVTVHGVGYRIDVQPSSSFYSSARAIPTQEKAA
jgi:hypothetical protein